MAINSLSNTYTSNGLSGMVSGMDTESMVQKLLSGTQAKIDAQNQKKTTLEYQQELYREISTMLKTFQSTYFSFSNAETNLYSDSLFNNMTATSSSSAVKVTASPTAEVGNFSIDKITQLATSTSITSRNPVSSALKTVYHSGSGNTYRNALKKETITVNVNGKDTEIRVWELAGKTNEEAVAKLNEELKGTGLTASYKNSDFVITSASKQEFSITASSEKVAALFGGTSLKMYSTEEGELDVGLNTDALLPTLNISLDGGTAKAITFDIFSEDGGTIQYDDMIESLNESLAKAFGSSVRVTSTDGENITFATYDSEGNVDPSRQITITGQAESLNILGVKSNASNKINLGMKLSEANFSSELKPSTTRGTYEFTINGVDFSFEADTTLNDIMNTVNNSSAGVKLSYSGISDKFTIESTVSGAGGTIEMDDEWGNLLETMFGKQSGTQVVNIGNEQMESITKNLDAYKSGTVTVSIGGRSLSVELDGKAKTVDEAIQQVTEKIRDAAAKSGFVELTDFELQKYSDTVPPTYRVVGVNIPIRFALKPAASTNGVAAPEITASTQSEYGVYTEGQNAILEIDGQKVERNTNTFEYKGHTLELRATSDERIDIETSRDSSKAQEAIKKFVESYNEINERIYTLLTEEATHREYPPLTEAQKAEMTEEQIELWEEKAKGGLMRADTLLQKLQSAMRSTIFQKAESSALVLYNLGIDTSASTTIPGNLVLDESKLEKMLLENPDEVRKLFTDAKTGISARFTEVVKAATNTSTGSPGYLFQMAGDDGIADSTSLMYKRIDDINDNLRDLAYRYEMQYDRYWKQFNNMESILNDLSAQSSWLLSQFSSTNSGYY